MKRILSCLLSFCITVFLLSAGVATVSSEASADVFYEISTPEELFALMQLSGSEDSGERGETLASNYRLTANIDLTEVDGQMPIGNALAPYTGIFDGAGHTISGLNIRYGEPQVGLFARVNGATIRNLTVRGSIAGTATENGDSAIKNYCAVGGMVGFAEGNTTLEGCVSFCSVSGAFKSVGGLIGYALLSGNGERLILRSCTNLGEVRGVSAVGGICGKCEVGSSAKQSSMIAESCVNYGGIAAEELTAGGVFGSVSLRGEGTQTTDDWNQNVATREFLFLDLLNSGSVSVGSGEKSDKNAGGIAGEVLSDAVTAANASFSRCVNTGSVTGGEYTGGLFGKTGGIGTNKNAGLFYLDYCINLGTVTTSGTGYVGRITGSVGNVQMQDCCSVIGSPEGSKSGESDGDISEIEAFQVANGGDNAVSITLDNDWTVTAAGPIPRSVTAVLGTSVSLSEDLALKVYTHLAKGGETMIFTMGGETATETAAPESGQYVFSFRGITPQSMADPIDIRLISEDGQILYEKRGYSIRDYCAAAFSCCPSGKDETCYKTMIADLLEYGAAAQRYLNYNTENPANADAVIAAYRTQETGVPDEIPDMTLSGESQRIRIGGGGVVFGNMVRLYIEYAGSDTAPNVVFEDGTELEYTRTATTVEMDGIQQTRYRIETRGLSPTEFGSVVRFTVSDGEAERTATYSVNTFVKRMLASGNGEEKAAFLRSVYQYGVSATAYAGSGLAE